MIEKKFKRMVQHGDMTTSAGLLDAGADAVREVHYDGSDGVVSSELELDAVTTLDRAAKRSDVNAAVFFEFMPTCASVAHDVSSPALSWERIARITTDTASSAQSSASESSSPFALIGPPRS